MSNYYTKIRSAVVTRYNSFVARLPWNRLAAKIMKLESQLQLMTDLHTEAENNIDSLVDQVSDLEREIEDLDRKTIDLKIENFIEDYDYEGVVQEALTEDLIHDVVSEILSSNVIELELHPKVNRR